MSPNSPCGPPLGTSDTPRSDFPRTKRERKQLARDHLLDCLDEAGTRLFESGRTRDWTSEQEVEMQHILNHELDRIARLFGYELS